MKAPVQSGGTSVCQDSLAYPHDVRQHAASSREGRQIEWRLTLVSTLVEVSPPGFTLQAPLAFTCPPRESTPILPGAGLSARRLAGT
jgi:hypothetical protein